MPDEVDGDLLERFAHGDQDAFESLFRQFEHEVYGWILRIVRDANAAEDALVEAFWRAYRGRARFDSSRSFGAWMRRIATNAALDQLRVARRDALRLGNDTSRSAPAPASDSLRESIQIAFGRLPPKLHIVAALALIEEQSYAEIAEALDLPIGTVKSRVFRATRALREELARLGIRV
ncbi:MAG: sigma-70 family RNA polymerase sigma factor [Acidobacteria bacterium]|nr:sigma-70 family RNA polymerase sigma factor [Acidobacteriota bacterium]